MIKLLLGLLSPHLKSLKFVAVIISCAGVGLMYWRYSYLVNQIQGFKIVDATKSKRIQELEIDLSTKTKEYEQTIDTLNHHLKKKDAIIKKNRVTKEELQKAIDDSSELCLKAELPDNIKSILGDL